MIHCIDKKANEYINDGNKADTSWVGLHGADSMSTVKGQCDPDEHDAGTCGVRLHGADRVSTASSATRQADT